MHKPTAPKAVSDINVTPLVDIMLVLLIILWSSRPCSSMALALIWRRRKTPGRCRTRKRKMPPFWQSAEMVKSFSAPTRSRYDEITTKVKDLISGKLDKTVFVKSDSRAKYGDVVKVVDNLRAAGVDSLGLLTEKLDRRGGPPGLMTP